jgi:hypothetical protein
MDKLRTPCQTEKFRKAASHLIVDNIVELMHLAWCELEAPQIIEVVTRMKDLMPEEERHKQELLFNPRPKS